VASVNLPDKCLIGRTRISRQLVKSLALIAWFMTAASLLYETSRADTNQSQETVANTWVEHGFTIDAHLFSPEQRMALRPALQRQLEIVESVGLPDKVIAFFRTIPIFIDPTLRDEAGRYSRMDGEWRVRVRPSEMSPIRPIILHELLHAYHHQVLSLDNPEILHAFHDAHSSNLYPRYRSAHFLDNEKEYFAVIGSIYLFGRIQQPPFTCELPATLQPEFIKFLEQQFGPHECKPDEK